jgi:hypothetical protein
MSAAVPGPGYPFRFLSEGPAQPGGLLLETYLCPFRTRYGDHYIAQVERYEYHVYVVKFYLKKHRATRDPDKRFQHQTNRGAAEALRVIHTCIRVMLYVIKRDPLASVGFIGTPKPGEKKANTQRYRIYTQMMTSYFAKEAWHHEDFGGESAYLLLNRRALAQDPDLLRHAAAMFDALYLMPGGLHPSAGPPEPAGVG